MGNLEEVFDLIFQETFNDTITETGVIVRSGGFVVHMDRETYDDLMDEMFEEIKNRLNNEKL